MNKSTLLIFQVIAALLIVSTADVVAADRDFDLKVQPFLKKNCDRCHGSDREEGDIRVDKLKWDVDDLASVDALQNILDEIVVGSMPPKGEPRPSRRALKDITDVLQKHVAAAKEKHSSGGGRPVRRLTKTEYINTLYDLLGVRVDDKELPEDGNVGSFDTEATELYTTDMHLQRCMVVARDAAKRFIASRHSQPGQKKLRPTRPPRATKKNKLGIKAAAVPPAGYQVTRLVCWLKDTQRSKPTFFGPSGSAVFEITGTSKSPQYIDRTFYKTQTETWSANPNVVLKEIQNFQVVHPQPYRFFEKFNRRYRSRMPDSAARALIEDFVSLMNRGRRVDRKFVSDLFDIFMMGRKQGQTFEEAMVEPMALAMCTVEAMFHFETRGAANDSAVASPIEMVNRIAYFLWRSAPDAELIRLAGSRKWNDPAVRKQQFVRMVEDEKFDRFLRDFTVQWLELDRQDEIAVDDRLFQKFNNNVKASMKEETIQFVSHVIRNDLPIRNLIDSDFMLVNNLLAQHYGIDGVRGNEFRVVPVQKGSKRGGILTHAGIMMQTGTGDRTSIVERGAFVARKLLNDPPGTPPPLVDDLPSTGQALAKLTGAQIVLMHRKAPQCASCHAKIDFLGTGLEELDAVGLFRTTDKRINPNIDQLSRRQRRNPNNLTIQVPLETDGRVMGRRYRGVEGLKRALLSKDERLAEAYIEALLSMANGRKSGVADEAIVRRLIDQSKTAKLPARSILYAVLDSDAFQVHVATPQE
ncbi:MAG: DUF1592 domain-containing protein [Fuerstiella sp.]